MLARDLLDIRNSSSQPDESLEDTSHKNEYCALTTSQASFSLCALYRCYSPNLFKQLRYRFDQELAEDLVQEAFLRLAIIRHQQQIDDAGAYLYRIAVNHGLDILRQQQRQQNINDNELIALISTSDTRDPAELHEQRCNLQMMAHTIESLPERCKECFVLNRQEGMSYQQVAQRMSISPKTVEKHITKALKSCREKLNLNDVNKPSAFSGNLTQDIMHV